jgi:hypothetical protein
LDELVSGGLFGKNQAEAAERLMARGIENALKDGTLSRQILRPGKTQQP